MSLPDQIRYAGSGRGVALDYFLPSIEEVHAPDRTGRPPAVPPGSSWTAASNVASLHARRRRRRGHHHADGTQFKVPAFDIVKCVRLRGMRSMPGSPLRYATGSDPETAVQFAQATSALNATGLGSPGRHPLLHPHAGLHANDEVRT